MHRFGPFELDPATGELRKHGIKVRLQAKPLELLKALLEQPGHPVSREELHRRLWPSETFGDFENGLNTAMNRLRLALGDSASEPRYVETLARTGYRFIAPLQPTSTAPPPPPSRRRFVAVASVAAAALLGVLYARLPRAEEAEVRQLTFRRGQVWSARFAPGGNTVLYTGQWETGPRQLYLTSPVSPESRPIGFDGMMLASVSSRGELALLSYPGTMNIAGATLLRAPMNGGSPLVLDRNIMSADWSANGSQLALVRAVNGVNQIEFPAGKTLFRTPGWVSHMRVSPRSGAIAFIHHPVRHEDAGSINVILPHGEVVTLSDGWANAGGLAWHPESNEVWFTAARRGAIRSLHAVKLSGRLRTVLQAPGMLTLRDISPDGRVLITRDSRHLEMAGSIHSRPERSYSWLDWSRIQDISADGNLILFDESGEGAGDKPVVYVQDTRTQSVVRIGEGRAMSLTPDAGAVLILHPDRKTFRLHPLRGGTPRTLPPTGLEHQWARFFPGGKRILSLAAEPGKALRLYVYAMDNPAKPQPISGEIMVRNAAIAPDGKKIAVLTSEGRFTLFDTDRPPTVLFQNEPIAPMRWSEDGQSILVQHLNSYTELPARFSLFQLRTATLVPWKSITPPDPMGVTGVTGIALSARAESYVYSYRRILSELFVAAGYQ